MARSHLSPERSVADHAAGPRTCLVDAHVHFYRPFDAWAGIEAAAENFSKAKERLSLPPESLGVLMFVRSSAEGPLRELHTRLSRRVPDGWTLCSDGDAGWLHVTRPSDRTTIYIVEGQQVKASNGLEVLALTPTTHFDDGQPFGTTLEKVLGSGAVTVIPWGFGKWLGERGRQVEGALENSSGGRLFLGDNPSRPRPLRDPKLFRIARTRGIFVLPGSDPLLVAAQERSIGRFGFVLDGFDPACPVESIRQGLAALRHQPEIFGDRDSLLGSVSMQIRLRLSHAEVHGSSEGARA